MRPSPRSLRPGLRQRTRRQRGVAVVEFALVLVPMLLIAFGVAEYGRAIYHYNTLVKSVRTATRIMSMANPDDVSYRSVTVPYAKCMAVYGNDTCTGSPLAPSLSVSQVQVCDRNDWDECTGANKQMFSDVPTGEGPIHLVRVRISGYEFPFIGLPLVTSSPTTRFSDIEAVMRQSS